MHQSLYGEVVEFVVGKVEDFKGWEVLRGKLGNFLDLIVLQIEVDELFEVLELLKSYSVVRKVKSRQVLEVAEILFDHIDNGLRRKLACDCFMRQLHSTGE